MNAVQIRPDIYWVGAIAWAIRDFHGYITPNGTTYSNYLAVDEKITLFDTVNHDFADTTIDNIRGVTDLAKIENIIINHIENDHVTSLDKIISLAPNATSSAGNSQKKLKHIISSSSNIFIKQRGCYYGC